MAEKLKKSNVIREYLEKHPEMGPKALAEKIMGDHPSLKVAAQEVSKYRHRTKASGAPRKKRAAEAAPPHSPSLAHPTISELVVRLHEAAQAVGGKEEAKRLLDLLS